MKAIYLILFIASLTNAHAAEQPENSSADSPKKPLSKEALEQIELAEDGIAAVDRLQQSIDKIGRKRRSACLKALGSDKFCTCLSKKLPIAIDFPSYVKVLISTKEELEYDTAGDKNKKLVDLTLQVREACVRGGY
ncbi:MAG: hypothetical protein ABL962_11915 [Fimbriimonadaceae bacterium]